jgi:hypothetical protein
MRDHKVLKRSDLIVRGLFLAVVVIGGIVGQYRLQCQVPAADGAYMYLRVSADGYARITTQYQPKARQAESEFDIVLQLGR